MSGINGAHRDASVVTMRQRKTNGFNAVKGKGKSSQPVSSTYELAGLTSCRRLNSPYREPARHWELDDSGQPTQRILESRRRAEFVTPIPKPKKRKGAADQSNLVFDEGKGLSTAQQYAHTAVINAVRDQVDRWRRIPNSADWRVSPETATPRGPVRTRCVVH
jgi:hypothetical protein